ncbi:hypothetical protein FRC09_020292 [Ceratobasidium sp. 395]|nr:hypothetical protein FRC09_020292 [Ceratobasidium sp. 395]
MVQVIRPLDVHAQLDAALTRPSIPPFSNTPADRSQAPPAYPAASSTPNPSCAPAYTAQPSPTERIISRTDSGAGETSSDARTNRRPLPEAYVNKSSRLVLNLGRRVWASRTPVYGANAVISGKVLVKKADHAINICITLEGVCQTTIVERGMPVAQFTTTLLYQTQNLWTNESSEPPQSSYDFGFAIPTYSHGSTEILPPSSYYAFLTRGYVEVKYYVKVDMTRARFHRHETVSTSIHYLPRSHPPPVDLMNLEMGLGIPTDDDYWRSTALSPWAPPGKRPPLYTRANLVSAEFSLLKNQAYTASTPIPFRLTLRASSPALALLPHATIQLVKRWVLIASEVNLRVAREAILGSGEIWRVEEGEEGAECARVVTGCVTGGKPGAETSWVIQGIFKVEYLVRVCIKPPEDMRSLGSTLPTFFHQEIVRMTTHEYTNNEMVRSQPATALAPRCFW